MNVLPYEEINFEEFIKRHTEAGVKYCEVNLGYKAVDKLPVEKYYDIFPHDWNKICKEINEKYKGLEADALLINPTIEVDLNRIARCFIDVYKMNPNV